MNTFMATNQSYHWSYVFQTPWQTTVEFLLRVDEIPGKHHQA